MPDVNSLLRAIEPGFFQQAFVVADITEARHAWPPKAGKDHSRGSRPPLGRPPGRSRVVTLGIPTVGIPAKLCDSSPVTS